MKKWKVRSVVATLALGVLIGGLLLPPSPAGAGLGASSLVASNVVGVLSTMEPRQSLKARFQIIDKSNGRVVWEADPSNIVATAGPGTITYSLTTGGEVIQGSGSYEWSFRVDARSSESPVYFSDFRQTTSNAEYVSQIPSHDTRGRISEALLSGAF